MSCEEREFDFFFANLNTFYFFLLSDCCSWTCSTMLNNSGESGHTCCVSDLKGKALSFSPLRMLLAVGFS